MLVRRCLSCEEPLPDPPHDPLLQDDGFCSSDCLGEWWDSYAKDMEDARATIYTKAAVFREVGGNTRM